MQISDATNSQGIFEEIDFFAQTDITIYPAVQKVRNINNRYREILTWIWEVYDGWQFNDSNQTDDVLYADQTLTLGTSVYAIPATAIVITGVEILLQGLTTWQKLIPFTSELIQQKYGAQSEFLKTNAVPYTYQLVGDSIKVLPPPNWTAATSLRVFFQKDIVPFAITDTTPAPGIPAMFHRALSIGGALDWALANKPELIAVLQNQFDGVQNPNSWKQKIQKFFMRRFRELSPAKLSVGDALGENR